MVTISFTKERIANSENEFGSKEEDREENLLTEGTWQTLWI